MARADELLEEINENTARALRYARLRFLATWLALGLLAILTCAALLGLGQNTQTDLEQNEEIARVADTNADEAKADTDDITAYLRGEQGIAGVPGENGQTGTPGLPSSEPGPAGERGPAGPAGPAGAQGPPGTNTVSSDPFTGSQGPAGAKGATGETGPAGTDGADGKDGGQGPAGPAGAQGERGPAGPPGDPHAITTTIATAVSANTPDEPKQVTAQCATGRVSGGGYAVVPSDPGIIVTASAPNANGWNATAEELSLPVATNWQLLTFAVCVS